MRKLNQSGEVNPFLVSTIALAVLLIASLVFGISVQGKYSDAKNNVDDKVSTAVSKAESDQKKKLDAEFFEKEKQPLVTYESPATLGTIKVSYPKTWSAYVEELDGQTQINGYFHPKFVPSPQKKIKYALRLQLKDAKYAAELQTWADNVKRGDLKASPVEVSGASGTRYDGKIDSDKQGAMVILPIRDKTIIVWSESPDYVADFNDIILKNFSFVP